MPSPPTAGGLVAGGWIFGEGVNVWDVDTGEQLANLNTGRHITFATVFAPDGKTLATSNHDGSIRLWNTEALDAHAGAAPTARGGPQPGVRPDGKTLASNTVGAGRDAITPWEVGTGRLVTTLADTSSPLWQLAFAPDGKTVATTCVDRSVTLWEIGSVPRKPSIPCPVVCARSPSRPRATCSRSA